MLPVGAIVLAGLSFAGAVALPPTSAALSALLGGFVAWAVTRELAPDDNPAAFLAVLLAWIMLATAGATSVVLPFVALLLVRIVNRTTGLPARPWDTVLVALFALWACWNLDQPLLALVAALAFAIDALLERSRGLGIVAAAVCAGFAAWQFAVITDPLRFPDTNNLLPVLALVACAIIAARRRSPRSRCDTFGNPLQPARVSAGLVIGSLVGFQSLLHGVTWPENFLWASLLAVPASAIVRSAWPASPKPTEREA